MDDLTRQEAEDDGGGLLPGVGVALWVAATVLFGWLSLRTPAPVPADAPAATGSAHRAYAVLEDLALPAGERRAPSRLTGTEANARTRDALVARLQALGLRTEVQDATVVVPEGAGVATVANVVGRLDGMGAPPGERHAICLMAHYDSVAAGPGIGDDLAGVAAILESVRALKSHGSLQRDLIVLFTDAEEQGLFGAEAFVQQHPWADEVGVVVNVEGRGARGPSRMFETGPGNGWSIAALSQTSRHPSATSVSSEIYRRMPNGTDFTVWIERGVPGLNHAFIGDWHAYHTPLDGLGRLSLGSLQHHVDNVIDAVRALDRTPLPEAGAATADAVFFVDPRGELVFVSARVVRIAAGLCLLLAVLTAGLVARRRGVVAVLGGLVAVPLVAVATVAAGHAARLGLGALGLPALAHPSYPGPTALAVLCAALAAGLIVVRVLARFGLSAPAALAASAVTLSGGAFALSFSVVGAVYLLLVPALPLVLLGPLVSGARFARGGAALVGILAACGAAAAWAPLQFALVDALGTASGLVLAAPLVLGLVALLPTLALGGGAPLGWLGGLALLGAVGAGALVLYLPDATVTEPGQLTIVRIEGEDSVLPSENPRTGDGERPAVRFALEGAPVHRALYLDALAEVAPALDLATYAPEPLARTRPTVEVGAIEDVVEEETGASEGAVRFRAAPRPQRIRARLRVVPRPGAAVLSIVAHETASNGIALFREGASAGSRLRWTNPPAEGFDLEIVTVPGTPVRVRDFVPGLDGEFTAAAKTLLDARPTELVPVRMGDGSVVDTVVTIGEREAPGGDASDDTPDAQAEDTNR